MRMGRQIAATLLSPSSLRRSFLYPLSVFVPVSSASIPSSSFSHIMRRPISDITGNVISVGNRTVVDMLDENIMNCISMHDDASGQSESHQILIFFI